MDSKLTFYQDKSVRWRWRLRSQNGEIIGCSSQSFISRQGATDNFALLRTIKYKVPGEVSL